MGLNDTDPSVALDPGQAQSALNVESSLSGAAIVKRRGYSRVASLTISTSAPTGAYSFIDANGNKQDIVCQDHNCAKSTNSGTFTVFLSTGGGTCMPTRWSFVQVNGKLYGANDCRDPILQYDGTTLSYFSGTAPLGSLLEVTKDRLVVSDIINSPNEVDYSQSGTYTNFVVGINSADPYHDFIGSSGDKIQGLKYSLGRLFIFKTNSITSCILQDQYTSQCFPVSNAIGTSDPLGIVEIPGGILFRSSDRNFWGLDNSGLSQAPISRKIAGFIGTQTSGSNQSNIQTSQSDWQTGTNFPSTYTWNTTSISGSILPSTTTLTDGTTTTYARGTGSYQVSTSDVLGISLSSTVFSDTWATGVTAGRLAWSVTNGAWQINSPNNLNNNGAGDPLADLTDRIVTSSVTISTGSWSWSWSYSSISSDSSICSRSRLMVGLAGNCLSVHFMETTGGDFYEFLVSDVVSGGPSQDVTIRKTVSGTPTVLANAKYLFNKNSTYQFNVVRSTDGRITDYVGGVFLSSTAADTSITSSQKNQIQGSHAQLALSQNITNFYAYQYPSSGTFVSQIFDTGYSTPTWGTLSATATLNTNETQANFYVYTSSSPNNDLWGAKTASSDTLRITNAPKRYAKYQVDLFTWVSSKTPTALVSLGAATTGQYVTQCIQPGSNITAWGQLSCAQTLAGAGSIVHYATSAATCAGLPSTPPVNSAGATQNGWTAQTNNATVSISTNAAMYYAFRSLLGSATDQAQIDACTVYWTNGNPTPQSWGVYDPTKNAVYWSAAITNSATANRVLKYDLNLNEWYPFGINAGVIYRNQNGIYFGESTGGYWDQYGSVTSDNGAAINAYWVSKDFGNQNNPFLDNNYNRISLVTKNQVTGSMTVAYTTSNNATTSYSVSLSTTSGVTYVHSNKNLAPMSPYQFMNINLGNNSTTGFEVDALQLDYSSWPWAPKNP